MSNTLVMRRYTAGKWRKMPRQIMKKITNKEYCSVNSNGMGIKYDPFSLTLSLENKCIIIDTYNKNIKIFVDF